MAKTVFRVVAVILILAMGFGAVGCSAPIVDNPTRTVKDQLEREVEVPEKVESIISTYYISTSMVLALGAGDRLVGIEMKADTRPLYQYVKPEIMELPQVGSAKALNIEEILRLEPDLLILPIRLQDSVEQLEELGLTVIVIDPEDLDSLLAAFLLLGEALGCEEKAQELVTYYEEKIALVEGLAAQAKDKPRVYLAGSELLRTCTREMYQHDVITLAGGDNVADGIETGYWANISLEQVLSWDPEVILLAEYNDAQAQELAQDEKWQGVAAVQNKQVYRFPSPIEPWDSPGPAAIQGILWLAHVLHPDAYSAAELEQEVEYFYGHFYGAQIEVEDFSL